MSDWSKLPPADAIIAIFDALPPEWWESLRVESELRTAPYRTKVTRAMLLQEVD